MHHTLLLGSTLLAILPLLSRARPNVSLDHADTSASGITIPTPMPSSASSSDVPIRNAAVTDSAYFIEHFLTQLVNAKQHALIATHYLAALEEKTLATRDNALAGKLKQAKNSALAQKLALAQAQGLANQTSPAHHSSLNQLLAEASEREAGQRPHQVRQSEPNRQPTCNLSSADKSRVEASRKAFSYDAINKGSKGNVGVLIASTSETFTTLNTNLNTAYNAPFVGDFKINNYPYDTEPHRLLIDASRAVSLALGSLRDLATGNENRSANVRFFNNNTVLDYTAFLAVSDALKQVFFFLVQFGRAYKCPTGY
ncbi:hypothetical protein IMSHALPRED_006009 [Imshaugia aleurites]|uniref:Uncharacterized protein n=1 Tax=Imshaugia aleurites TaxID=172621 RepID=A0A8H3IRX3_9LECA|nr:hypothetical protein IMSHALPRED_006009 [Imshaugia aleurites]